MTTIRLIYPQWQGGNISSLVSDLSIEDSSKGYILGSFLLNFLAPETKNETYTVPIDKKISKREEKEGILDYKIIIKQSKKALEIIKKANPDKILTFGGECSTSVIPFTYLNKKYNNDTAVIWIDAHPDITLPYDNYNGYHAMAVSAIMGKVNENINKILPSFIDPSKILFLGLRDWEREEIKIRQKEYKIKHLINKDINKNSNKILSWIKSTGAKKVMIHFDLDVLDPKEIIAAVGVVPCGLKINEVIRIINDISKEYNLIALTITEPMPKVAIKLKNMLNQLPLMG